MSDDDLTAAYLLARKDADDEIKRLRAALMEMRDIAIRILSDGRLPDPRMPGVGAVGAPKLQDD